MLKMIRNFTLHLAAVLLIALSIYPLVSPQAVYCCGELQLET